jgi:hypothetical protein
MQESYTDKIGAIYDLVSDAEDIVNYNFSDPSTPEGRRAVIAKNKLRDALMQLLELNRQIQIDRQGTK